MNIVIPMRALFLDLARTVVDFSPGYHNELGAFLRSAGYCVTDREVFREIAKQRAWLPLPAPAGNSAGLDFRSLAESITGEEPDETLVSDLQGIDVTTQTCRIHKDMERFLEETRELGIRTVLIADTVDIEMGTIHKLGLEDLVDGTAYAIQAGLSRRGSGVFHEAVKIAGRPGIFVGDTYEVDAADAAISRLPFLLLDREDYYTDVRRDKIRSADELLKRLIQISDNDRKASIGLQDCYPSPVELPAGRKPQVAGATLNHMWTQTRIRHRTGTRSVLDSQFA